MTTASDTPQRARQISDAEHDTRPFSSLGGQMRNTFKDFVSIIRAQYYGAEKPKDPDKLRPQTGPVQNGPDYWKDWGWQVRLVVRDVGTFQ